MLVEIFSPSYLVDNVRSIVGNVGRVLFFCKFVDFAYGSVHKPVTKPARQAFL